MDITPKSKKTSKHNVKRQKKNMELKSSKKIKTEKVLLKFITKINCLTTNLYLYFYNKVVSYKDK